MYQRIDKIFSNPHIRIIVRGGAATMIGKIIALALSFATSLLISRWYGADVLGLVAIINSIIMFLTIISVMGLDTAMLKLIPKYSSRDSLAAGTIYNRILMYTGLSSIAISIILILSPSIIAIDFFSKPELEYFIYLLGLVFIFQTYHKINSTLIRGFEKATAFAFIQILPSLVIFFGIFILHYFLSNKYLPLYVYIFSSIIVFVIGMLITFKLSHNKKENVDIPFKRYLEVSLPMMLSSSMFFLASQTDILMLGAMASAIDTGIYSVSVKLAGLTIFVIVALNSMMAPRFSKLYHSGSLDELESVVKFSSKIIFFATVPIVSIIIIFGEFLLNIFGEDFIMGYNALIFLVVGQFFNAVCGPTGNLMNMTGLQSNYMKIVLISSILNIILNYILIPVYGIEGAAFATMISNTSLNLMATIAIRYHMGYFIFYNPFEYILRRK